LPTCCSAGGRSHLDACLAGFGLGWFCTWINIAFRILPHYLHCHYLPRLPPGPITGLTLGLGTQILLPYLYLPTCGLGCCSLLPPGCLVQDWEHCRAVLPCCPGFSATCALPAGNTFTLYLPLHCLPYPCLPFPSSCAAFVGTDSAPLPAQEADMQMPAAPTCRDMQPLLPATPTCPTYLPCLSAGLRDSRLAGTARTCLHYLDLPRDILQAACWVASPLQGHRAGFERLPLPLLTYVPLPAHTAA